MFRGDTCVRRVVRSVVDDCGILANRRDGSETDATIEIVRAVNRASNSSATSLKTITRDRDVSCYLAMCMLRYPNSRPILATEEPPQT